MRRCALLILFQLFVLLLLTCCNTEPELDFEVVEMPVRISIPIGTSNMQRQMPAAMGDPGSAETFLLPRYAYIYLICKTINNTILISSFTPKNETDTLTGEWVAETYSGSLSYKGDKVYRYQDAITLSLPAQENRQSAYVYAAFSYDYLNLADAQTEEKIKNLQFDLTPTLSIKDIYSTPYNYCPDGTYYGTIANISTKVPQLNILLYHVASKVDLMWNVDESLRKQMRITSLTVQNLYSGKCYLFRPTENRYDGEIVSSTLTRESATNVPSTWWEGRDYFYTIPYLNNDATPHFPLQLHFQLNDLSGETPVTKDYNVTLMKSLPASDAFVPWIRGQMTFTQIKSGTETKIID